LPNTNKVGVRDNGVNYMFRLWKQKALSYCEGTTFENARLRRLQSRSRATDPTIWIGKEGASEHLIQQVESQLRARELVKLKLQKSALAKSEIREMAEKIAASTDSTLVDVIGHTFTLYQKRGLTKSMRERSSKALR
jgi:RNA-binding protein